MDIVSREMVILKKGTENTDKSKRSKTLTKRSNNFISILDTAEGRISELKGISIETSSFSEIMQARCKILRETQKQKTQPINLYPPKLFLQMKAKQGLFQTKIESISR